MLTVVASLLLLTTFQPESPDSGRLLPVWPDAGPPLVLEIKGLGNGYSSPAIAGGRIFVTGETDSTGYLLAFDLKGAMLWKTSYGKEFTLSFQGSRAAPVAAENLVYICSGTGEILCFETESGRKRWSVNMVKDLGGINPTFGYSIPPAINQDKLFCNPGGPQNNVVALNRFTGELIWSSPAKGETAGYGASLLIELPDRTILITSSEFNILGLDANTGVLLWCYELAFKGEVPCNAPVFDDRNIYWSAGPGNGAVAAELSPEGSKIKVKWKNIEFDTFFGGFVRAGDYLYGSSDGLRKYVSIDTKTGKIRKNLAFGIGSVISAGNQLIGYNQRGQVGLIRPAEEKMELTSTFKVASGTGEHFSHPVISGGRLYIRHGDTLLAYNIGTDE